jgi:serine protease inhibitor
MMSSVFLPKTTSDIDKLIGELASNSKLLFSGFQELEGNLFLPRFKVEFETSLKKHLMTMGKKIPRIFPNFRNGKAIY